MLRRLTAWVKSQHFGGFMNGILATIIGFSMAASWDFYKINLSAAQRDEVILSAVKQELVGNVGMIKENQLLLQRDLDLLKQNMSLIEPLPQLQNGFWDLIKINFPRKLVERPEMLHQIEKIFHQTYEVNEAIRSRESYRIYNRNSPGFSSTLAVYDEVILGKNDALLSSLKKISPEL